MKKIWRIFSWVILLQDGSNSASIWVYGAHNRKLDWLAYDFWVSYYAEYNCRVNLPHIPIRIRTEPWLTWRGQRRKKLCLKSLVSVFYWKLQEIVTRTLRKLICQQSCGLPISSTITLWLLFIFPKPHTQWYLQCGYLRNTKQIVFVLFSPVENLWFNFLSLHCSLELTSRSSDWTDSPSQTSYDLAWALYWNWILLEMRDGWGVAVV